MKPARQGRRAAVLAGVLALHLAGAGLLATSRPAPRSPAVRQPPALTVRLLSGAPPLPARAAPVRSSSPVAAPVARRTPSSPRRAVAPAAAHIAIQAAALPASAPASDPPLDLRLPPSGRGVAAPPPAAAAAADPRANVRGQPARWEDRVAQRLDTRLHETLQTDGRQRLRRGAGCIDLAPARIAGLDPWTSRDAPRAAAPCP